MPSAPELIELPSVAGREPWKKAIARPILWAWRLVNHQGYADGIQLAFYEPGPGTETVVIQLMGKASMIEVSTLEKSSATD